jgi:hypothetical protein
MENLAQLAKTADWIWEGVSSIQNISNMKLEEDLAYKWAA